MVVTAHGVAPLSAVQRRRMERADIDDVLNEPLVVLRRPFAVVLPPGAGEDMLRRPQRVTRARPNDAE